MNQTYKNVEILVIDNFSLDNTKEACERFPVQFIRYKGSRSAARNLGLERAKGEFILFLDSDQVLSSTVLEECVDLTVSASANCIFIPTKWIEYKPSGSFINCVTLHNLEVEIGVRIDIPFFYSRDIIGEQRFDEKLSLGEDYLFFIQTLKRYPKIARTKAIMYHFEDPDVKGVIRRSWRYGIMSRIGLEDLGYRYLQELSVFRKETLRGLFFTALSNPSVIFGFLFYCLIKYFSFLLAYISVRL